MDHPSRVKNILSKLGANDRTHAAMISLKRGNISLRSARYRPANSDRGGHSNVHTSRPNGEFNACRKGLDLNCVLFAKTFLNVRKRVAR
jgi:hypothetical protein